jgi:DNA-binding GntR family transcriptional regulator
MLDKQIVRRVYMRRLYRISSIYKRGQITESSRIYRELKQDIVTCTLEPGLSISEQEMCLRYKASRTPVREACRQLCSESLMQVIPFRGYNIPTLTFEEYHNLHELQSIVEPSAAALAAERATQAHIKEIESWASYEYHVGQKNSYYTFLEWNRNFHICIAAASRNNAFLDVVRYVQTRLMRYYYLVIVMDSYGPELIEEHQQLVRAIKSGNPELARTRATEHLSNTSRRSANVDLRSVNFSNDGLLGEEYTRGLLNASTHAIWTDNRVPLARPRKLRAT